MRRRRRHAGEAVDEHDPILTAMRQIQRRPQTLEGVLGTAWRSSPLGVWFRIANTPAANRLQGTTGAMRCSCEAPRTHHHQRPSEAICLGSERAPTRCTVLVFSPLRGRWPYARGD